MYVYLHLYLFRREETPYYALTIIASDGATSSLRRNNKPNQTSQKFRIVIKDKNDNPPFFKKQVGVASFYRSTEQNSFLLIK